MQARTDVPRARFVGRGAVYVESVVKGCKDCEGECCDGR
jgi:hypothetical protein